jgi:hypothetical protein
MDLLRAIFQLEVLDPTAALDRQEVQDLMEVREQLDLPHHFLPPQDPPAVLEVLEALELVELVDHLELVFLVDLILQVVKEEFLELVV